MRHACILADLRKRQETKTWLRSLYFAALVMAQISPDLAEQTGKIGEFAAKDNVNMSDLESGPQDWMKAKVIWNEPDRCGTTSHMLVLAVL